MPSNITQNYRRIDCHSCHRSHIFSTNNTMINQIDEIIGNHRTMWNLSDSCNAKVIYETGTGLFYSGTFQNKPHINSKSLINCQDKDCSIRANKEDMGIHQLLVDRDAMQHRPYSDDKSKLKRKQQDSLEALKADAELSL